MQDVKKVLILCNSSEGLYSFRHDLITSIGEQAEVYVVTPVGNRMDLLEKICKQVIPLSIDRRGTNPLKDVKLLLNYGRIMKSIKPDLVLTYTIKPNIYGGLMSRIKKIPYAVNITGLGTAIENGGLLRKMVCTMYRFVLGKAKVVFFENNSNRDRMVELGAVKKEKTKVLHGAGVNLEEYPENSYPKDEVIKFLFVGRLMKEKGVEELLTAAKRLKEEFGNKEEIHLVGAFEEEYKETVEMLEKEAVIYYHGVQDDVRSFYEKCSAVVLPSYHEGMSNVLLEGAATGRPLITSNIPGCREAVIDGKTGFLCESKNAEDLYRKMKMFMELSTEQKRELGIASRKYIGKNFDKKDVVKETIEALMY